MRISKYTGIDFIYFVKYLSFLYSDFNPCESQSFSLPSRLVVGPIQPPVKWVSFLGTTRPERGVNHRSHNQGRDYWKFRTILLIPLSDIVVCYRMNITLHFGFH